MRSGCKGAATGTQKLFDIDLRILKGIAQYFQRHPDWGPGRDWLGIYEECCRILYEELIISTKVATPIPFGAILEPAIGPMCPASSGGMPPSGS